MLSQMHSCIKKIKPPTIKQMLVLNLLVYYGSIKHTDHRTLGAMWELSIILLKATMLRYICEINMT